MADHWDTHARNFVLHKDKLLPASDLAYAALLTDLAERGLLESTLVVCMGEFGRTPRFGQFTGNGINETGRDHWSQCYSLVLARGSEPGGRIIGRSDRFAAYPVDDPVTPSDLAASLLDALGVDPQREVGDAFTRTVPLTPGKVKAGLL